MRDDRWRVAIVVDGEELKEHTIEDHTCVQARPGKHFQVEVQFVGLTGYYVVELFLDGKSVAGGKWIDAVGDTICPQDKHTFTSFEKRVDGQVTYCNLMFERADAAGDEDSRPALTKDWSRGCFCLRVYRGERKVLQQDERLGDFKADQRKERVNESTMVKNGLSTTVGSGAVRFDKLGDRRAGDIVVCSDRSVPPIAEYELFFRDSFFMALNDDTCCNGRCKRAADTAGPSVRERAMEDHRRVGSSSETARARRERLLEMRETAEALSRKRPADEGPIDLCDSDDDDEQRPSGLTVD